MPTTPSILAARQWSCCRVPKNGSAAEERMGNVKRRSFEKGRNETGVNDSTLRRSQTLSRIDRYSAKAPWSSHPIHHKHPHRFARSTTSDVEDWSETACMKHLLARRLIHSAFGPRRNQTLAQLVHHRHLHRFEKPSRIFSSMLGFLSVRKYWR